MEGFREAMVTSKSLTRLIIFEIFNNQETQLLYRDKVNIKVPNRMI